LDKDAQLRKSEAVISSRTIASKDCVAVLDVACRQRAGHGHEIEYATSHALVFVRRGCFVRSADGASSLLDPTLAFCMSPGEEQRYDHPHEHGDDCTVVALDEGQLASLWGGRLPSGALPTSPAIDLEHRLLLAAARRGGDPDELSEQAMLLAAAALEEVDAPRIASGRPATERAQRQLADGAREALAANPECSRRDLSRQLAVSPHHLSRLFRVVTGHTIARHRMRLRVRAALERLIEGEHDLARLAAEVGFADQSHMSRVVRSELGRTPSALRAALSA
jgi:AraC-like DNA-binding protein